MVAKRKEQQINIVKVKLKSSNTSFLNVVRSGQSLMGCGSEFQREGAATEKALSE